MWMQLSRTLKHLWHSEARLQPGFSPALQENLAQQVKDSEQAHSGEIRIYIETALPLRYAWRAQPIARICRDRAVDLFASLRVWDTQNNNGVLIYLLLAERRIELVADRGLLQLVDPLTWQHLLADMRDAFRRADYDTGMSQCVDKISELLVRHYPLAPGQANPNELPDLPTMG